MVRESQKKRGDKVEIVDEVIELLAEHKKSERECLVMLTFLVQYKQESARRELNLLQKEIGQLKKNKQDATELLEKKSAKDKEIAEMAAQAVELLRQRDLKASTIGNIVDKDCHVSLTEVGFDDGRQEDGSCVGRQPDQASLASGTQP